MVQPARLLPLVLAALCVLAAYAMAAAPAAPAGVDASPPPSLACPASDAR